MKYKIYFSTSFKKSYKLCKKRHFDMSLFDEVYHLLEQNGRLLRNIYLISCMGNLKACGNVT